MKVKHSAVLAMIFLLFALPLYAGPATLEHNSPVTFKIGIGSGEDVGNFPLRDPESGCESSSYQTPYNYEQRPRVVVPLNFDDGSAHFAGASPTVSVDLAYGQQAVCGAGSNFRIGQKLGPNYFCATCDTDKFLREYNYREHLGFLGETPYRGNSCGHSGSIGFSHSKLDGNRPAIVCSSVCDESFLSTRRTGVQCPNRQIQINSVTGIIVPQGQEHTLAIEDGLVVIGGATQLIAAQGGQVLPGINYYVASNNPQVLVSFQSVGSVTPTRSVFSGSSLNSNVNVQACADTNENKVCDFEEVTSCTAAGSDTADWYKGLCCNGIDMACGEEATIDGHVAMCGRFGSGDWGFATTEEAGIIHRFSGCNPSLIVQPLSYGGIIPTREIRTVECADDSDCSGACSSRLECVECTSDSHCAGIFTSEDRCCPRNGCHPDRRNTCVECLTDADCQGIFSDGVCNFDNQCEGTPAPPPPPPPPPPPIFDIELVDFIAIGLEQNVPASMNLIVRNVGTLGVDAQVTVRVNDLPPIQLQLVVNEGTSQSFPIAPTFTEAGQNIPVTIQIDLPSNIVDVNPSNNQRTRNLDIAPDPNPPPQNPPNSPQDPGVNPQIPPPSADPSACDPICGDGLECIQGACLEVCSDNFVRSGTDCTCNEPCQEDDQVCTAEGDLKICLDGCFVATPCASGCTSEQNSPDECTPTGAGQSRSATTFENHCFDECDIEGSAACFGDRVTRCVRNSRGCLEIQNENCALIDKKCIAGLCSGSPDVNINDLDGRPAVTLENAGTQSVQTRVSGGSTSVANVDSATATYYLYTDIFGAQPIHGIYVCLDNDPASVFSCAASGNGITLRTSDLVPGVSHTFAVPGQQTPITVTMTDYGFIVSGLETRVPQ